MRKKIKESKVITDDEFQSVSQSDRENLPKIGVRCLFIFRSWDTYPVDNFRAYGYRDDVDTVYLPLYKIHLSILCVKSWYATGGELFYNGNI